MTPEGAANNCEHPATLSWGTSNYMRCSHMAVEVVDILNAILRSEARTDVDNLNVYPFFCFFGSMFNVSPHPDTSNK